MKSSRGRVVVITGSRGTGLATGRRLATHGAAVALAARTRSELELAACGLRHGVMARVTDVGDEAEVEGLIAAVVRRFGRLDVLVCSHGVSPGHLPIPSLSSEVFRETLRIDLVGAFFCASAAARVMIKARHWRHDHRRLFHPRLPPATRSHGLQRLEVWTRGPHSKSRGGPRRSRDHGQRRRARMVDTAMSAAELARFDGLTLNPLNRAAHPREIVDLIAWLAGSQSSFVTGTVFTIDGGQTDRRATTDSSAVR